MADPNPTTKPQCSDTHERYRFQPQQIGSIVFGARWDKPTAVGAGDGGTFIPQPVYQHEMAKLLAKITDLETRLARLEAATNG